MLIKDMKQFNDTEPLGVLVDEDLHELTAHGNWDFPATVYHISLSLAYLKQIRWHWHPEVEFIYLIEGKVDVLVDEETLRLNPGEGIFINQNVLHSFHSVDGFEAIFTTVIFHPSMVFGYGNTALSAKYLSPILDNPNMKHLLLNKSTPYGVEIIELLLKIRDDFFSAHFGFELICKANICNLWNALLKAPREEQPAITKTKQITYDEQRIKDAIIYIENNFTEPITLDDIANSIHISKSECCRCFKRILHLTPFDYLLKYRISHAAKLIQQKDPAAESISNLAITVGFGNISYFNKIFKRYLSMTPTEYKKECSRTS